MEDVDGELSLVNSTRACGQRHHDRLVDEWNHDGKHRWVDDHRSGNWSDLHPEPIR
jgi:hypothetical protein